MRPLTVPVVLREISGGNAFSHKLEVALPCILLQFNHRVKVTATDAWFPVYVTYVKCDFHS